MFREEPLARPCVSLTEPSNNRPKTALHEVPETPPSTLGGVLVWYPAALMTELEVPRPPAREPFCPLSSNGNEG